MLPLRDNIPSRTFPFVNYTMIGLCSLVFLAQLVEQPGEDSGLVEKFGMIPALVSSPDQPLVVRQRYVDRNRRQVIEVETTISPAIPPLLTMLTCIFLHGGWMHFLGNMWFLHIFGDNVEDRFGHVGFAVFYLAAGILASLAHFLTNGSSPVPTIGASGAIAGVMGAYFLLYPSAQVQSLVPFFGFIQVMVLPAPLFLGVWFLMQFAQGAASVTTVATSGVAWWAHVGGFGVGVAVAALLRTFGQTTPPVEMRRTVYVRPVSRWH